MDRFIGIQNFVVEEREQNFKIQYGQIYRVQEQYTYDEDYKFKIQYGQIYRKLLISEQSQKI